MTEEQKPPTKPLNLQQAIERYRLTQTPAEKAFLMSYFHRLQGALAHGKPTQSFLWEIFAEIWDQARVAGATQMRRSVMAHIGGMLDDPPPPPPTKTPPQPPIMVVEQLDRDFCIECAKESS